jgi:hypothetical protein
VHDASPIHSNCAGGIHGKFIMPVQRTGAQARRCNALFHWQVIAPRRTTMKSIILAAAIAATTLGFAGTASADSRGQYRGGHNHGGHYHGGYHNHGHNHGYYAPRYYGNYGYNAYRYQPYAAPYGNSVYYNSPGFGIGFTWAR